jgi:hypothetical protein
MILIPDYQNPSTTSARPPAVLRYIAIFCGAVPLFTGFMTLGLWIVTRSSRYESHGLMVIMGGLLLFAAGFLCLFSYWVLRARRAQSGLRSPRIWWIWLLLLSNFPGCAVCVQTWEYLRSRSFAPAPIAQPAPATQPAPVAR